MLEMKLRQFLYYFIAKSELQKDFCLRVIFYQPRFLFNFIFEVQHSCVFIYFFIKLLVERPFVRHPST